MEGLIVMIVALLAIIGIMWYNKRNSKKLVVVKDTLEDSLIQTDECCAPPVFEGEIEEVVEEVVPEVEEVVVPELTDDEKDKIVIDDFLVDVLGFKRETITNMDRFNASLFFPKVYEEPAVTLNDIAGKQYGKTPYMQTCLFVVKDADNLPRNVRMPKELYDALVHNFKLYTFNSDVQKNMVSFSNTIGADELSMTLKRFDIQIGSFDYNDQDKDKPYTKYESNYNGGGKVLFGNMRPKKPSPEEIEAAFKNRIDSAISGTGASNSYRLTYSEGPKGELKAVTKYAVNKEMYLHYIAHFRGAIPSGEDFIAWYEQACDDVTRLTDEPNQASR